MLQRVAMIPNATSNSFYNEQSSHTLLTYIKKQPNGFRDGKVTDQAPNL